MPPAHGKAQVLAHGLAHDLLVLVIVTEGEFLFGLRAFELGRFLDGEECHELQIPLMAG
jgi:hypothetical protein